MVWWPGAAGAVRGFPAQPQPGSVPGLGRVRQAEGRAHRALLPLRAWRHTRPHCLQPTGDSRGEGEQSVGRLPAPAVPPLRACSISGSLLPCAL